MTSLPQKPCWQSTDAAVMLSTEALEGDPKLFIATHVPLAGFHVAGARAGDVSEGSESALLQALAEPGVRHAFCVVEGEPGSGKSHLIRWLSVKWSAPDDLILLIQRLDGSLQGTLRQLERSLPEEFRHLFDVLGQAQELTTAGRARVFHTNLAHAFELNHFTHPLADAEWCDKFRLADMLRERAVLESWKAPERIMELLSGKKGKRDQELARFNLDDVADLELITRSLRSSSIKAVRFARELQKEADGIRQMSMEEKRNPALQEELRSTFPNSAQFVDALNLRRNNAVQTVLGISSEGLKELFVQLRRGLKNRRLVLLLEDITSWEGVDNQLIDVLVTNVDTRADSDLCPMISVVGITPSYFNDTGFQSNYRQRITHHVRLGDEREGSQYQDVASLRTEDEQIAFAATYLRAIRAGTKNLKEWDSDHDSVPNKCDSCPVRVGCHEVFGHQSGVGLFPFNRNAIIEIFASLSDPSHQSTYQTPRGMIQGVLTPSLVRSAGDLSAGRYPDRQLTALDWLPEEKWHLRGIPADVLRARTTEDRQRERLERIVVFWGDADALVRETTVDERGELHFGGVPRRLYDSFQYPWPGDEAPTPQVRQSPTGDGAKEKGSATPESESGPRQATDKPTRQAEGTARRHAVPPSELEGLRKDLHQWAAGKRVEQEAKLNQALFDVAERTNFCQLEIPPWVRRRLFTRDNFILEDTRKARSNSFVIQKADWVSAGLEAYITLRTARDVTGAEQETHQRHYAGFVRKLKQLMRERVEVRLPKFTPDVRWPIAQTATQVLLARNWLRGTISPIDSPAEQWKTVLQDEKEAISGPQDRVESWNDVIVKTAGGHGMIRAVLRELVNMPMDSGNSMLLVDAGSAARAIVDVCQTLKLRPYPAEIQDAGQQLAELEALSGYAKEVDQRLSRLPKYELERLRSSAEAINETLQDTSVPEYLERAARAIDKVAELLPTAAPALVRASAIAYGGLRDKGFLVRESNSPSAQLEQWMDSILAADVDALIKEPANALDRVARAPASDLRILVEALKQSSTTIRALTSYAEEFVSSSPGEGGGLKDIHDVGKEIAKTAGVMAQELR